MCKYVHIWGIRTFLYKHPHNQIQALAAVNETRQVVERRTEDTDAKREPQMLSLSVMAFPITEMVICRSQKKNNKKTTPDRQEVKNGRELLLVEYRKT